MRNIGSIEQVLANIRPDLKNLRPYSSARSLVSGQKNLALLDANEAPFSPLLDGRRGNRYPEQQPPLLLRAVADLYQVQPEQVFAGRGADEAIDLLIRLFGQAGNDCVLHCPPTFPMYSHSAHIQGVSSEEVPLLPHNYQLDVNGLSLRLATRPCPLAFFCSPNNPTGNLLHRQDIIDLLAAFPATLFVIDETYFEYAQLSCQLAGREPPESLLSALQQFPNLVVLRTLSKSHACAGLRCGFAIAHPKLIHWLTIIAAPYPLPQPVTDAVLAVLQPQNLLRLGRLRQQLLRQSQRMVAVLQQSGARWGLLKVFPSDANFVLARFQDSQRLLQQGRARGVIIRDQGHQPGLEGCLRFSAGSAEDVDRLIALLEEREYQRSKRWAQVARCTNETSIEVEVDLDCPGQIEIATGIGFYDHMLAQLARHGGFSLRLQCVGDLHVDAHHSIEDCAVALGQALRQALGEKRGIARYGFLLPMDEAEAQACLDLSGRFFLSFEAQFHDTMVGDFPTQMTEHFFYSLAENLAANLHLKVSGKNDHHQVEALFKACGRVLAQAINSRGDDIPSTKGML